MPSMRKMCSCHCKNEYSMTILHAKSPTVIPSRYASQICKAAALRTLPSPEHEKPLNEHVDNSEISRCLKSKKSFVVIDLRPGELFQELHIPGSTNLPLPGTPPDFFGNAKAVRRRWDQLKEVIDRSDFHGFLKMASRCGAGGSACGSDIIDSVTNTTSRTINISKYDALHPPPHQDLGRGKRRKISHDRSETNERGVGYGTEKVESFCVLFVCLDGDTGKMAAAMLRARWGEEAFCIEGGFSSLFR